MFLTMIVSGFPHAQLGWSTTAWMMERKEGLSCVNPNSQRSEEGMFQVTEGGRSGRSTGRLLALKGGANPLASPLKLT